MAVIKLETYIAASVEICFDLSLSVDLHQISTNQTGEHIVGGVKKGVMQLGETVTWKARHFAIWQTLETKITEMNAPYYFCDEMLKGAFQSMRHEHYFDLQPDKMNTRMRDVFQFTSPLGILGRIANSFVLEAYMKRFLVERNQTIKQYAESGQWKEILSKGSDSSV